ncbi:MADS-box MEF2 type transcription factor MIG1-like [Venturia canescens]|nr:MADS-box MEF2 type transcription factor MIG1-like [Venturia canescens]
MEISSSSEGDSDDSFPSLPEIDPGSETEDELLRDPDERRTPPQRRRSSTAHRRSPQPTSAESRDRSPRSPRRVPSETRYSPSRDPSPNEPRSNPRRTQPPPPRSPAPMEILEELLEALDRQEPFGVDDNPVFDNIRPYAPLLAAGEFVRPGFLDALIGLIRALTHRRSGYCPIAEGLQHPRSMGSSATIKAFPPTRDASSQTTHSAVREVASQTEPPTAGDTSSQTNPPTARDVSSQTLPVDGPRDTLERQLSTPQEPEGEGTAPASEAGRQRERPREQRTYGRGTSSAQPPAPTKPHGGEYRTANRSAGPRAPRGRGVAPNNPAPPATTATTKAPEVPPKPSGRQESTSRYGRCFNCGSASHRRQTCTQPPRQFCFRCGELDVTVRTCPKHGSAYEKEEPWNWNRR